MFSEDEAESYVQTAHGNEEKCGDEREFVNVVGKNRCPDAKTAIPHSSSVPTSIATRGKRDYLQCLENPEWSEAELRTEDREKVVEEVYRPRDLGKEEKDELEDNEKTVEHCPEGTCGLIGNRATPERYTVNITIYQATKGKGEPYVAASSIAQTCVML
jgi:hypothetical protein